MKKFLIGLVITIILSAIGYAVIKKFFPALHDRMVNWANGIKEVTSDKIEDLKAKFDKKEEKRS